jgi:hypothetical protein
MKAKHLTLLLLGTGLIFTMACTKYPPDSERLTQDLAIVTQYDTKISFKDYKTFSIPTSIIKVTSKDTTYLSDATAKAVLDQIENDMKNYGYSKVISPTKPDFSINVTYFQNTYIYTYYYDWWGYYPYWYYSYPYYPAYYSSYTSGMLVTDLIDLKSVNITNQQLYIRWSAYIRGLLTGGHTTNEILGTIDQAFNQSPQIKTSGK